MWQVIKQFFSLETKPVVEVIPVRPPPPARPATKRAAARHVVIKSKYYRRNGKFYRVNDDSLVIDVIVAAELMDLFCDDEMVNDSDIDFSGFRRVAIIDETPVDEIDAAVEAVSESISTTSYSDDSSDSSYD